MEEKRTDMNERTEDVIQSRGFVQKSGVLDKKAGNVEKKDNFLMRDWKIVRNFVPMYHGL
jgi:hypothetical protein